MAIITSSGLALIAQQQAAGQALVIDKFIFADVAGVDPAVNPPASTVMPAAGDIKHEANVTKCGYVGPDTVVYSSVLSSAVGDFYFNWIGLYSSADSALVAVSYVPRQQKKKTAEFTMGNTLTKNFALQYQNLTELTGIEINASTWQIDLWARLIGIDERERMSNYDIYGIKYFFGDGFKIVKNGDAYDITAGSAYVDGIRITLAANQALGEVGVLPKNIYLDACLNGDYSGVEALWTPQITTSTPAHYTDAANQQHYLEKIAVINADGTVTDCRGDGTGGTIRAIDSLDSGKANVSLNNITADGKIAALGLMTGCVLQFASADTIPAGFLICNGAAVSRTTYSALFAMIGTTYGVGDGSTTFNLPDFRGAFLRGYDGIRSGAIGTPQNDGLPNITGTIVTNANGEYSAFGEAILSSRTGALGVTTRTQQVISGSSSTVTSIAGITFNASNADSIYGASSYVTPYNYAIQYIIKY